MFLFKRTTFFFLCFFLIFIGKALCLPEGSQVASGQVGFDNSTPGKVNISASDKSIINWQNFNIAGNEWVNFIQPSSAATCLNRVIGANPSEILGKLTSNGHIFLVNPNGIFFGKDAIVDVGALTCSTLDIKDQDFLNGNYVFERIATPASIINQGSLYSQSFINLFSSTFQNSGTIQAKSVTIAGADKLSLNLDPFVEIIVDKPLDQNPQNLSDQIKNTGTIESTDGRVYIEAQSLPNLFTNAINTKGIIKATSVRKEENEIELVAHEPIYASGTFHVHDGALKLKTKTHLTMGDNGFFDIQGSPIITDPQDWFTINAPIDYVGDTIINSVDDDGIRIIGAGFVTCTGSITFNADNDGNGLGDFTMVAGTRVRIIGAGNITITGANITTEILGGNVITVTTNPGDININNNIIALGSFNLTAIDDININNAGTVVAALGAASFITADSDASGAGNFVMAPGTNITMTNVPITITGANATVDSIATLGAGGITIQVTGNLFNTNVGAPILTSAGNITLRGGGGAVGQLVFPILTTCSGNLQARALTNIYLNNNGNPVLTAFSAGAPAGNIAITNVGNISLGDPAWLTGSIEADNGNITLQAVGGSILDVTTVAAFQNIFNPTVAGSVNTLTAANILGTLATPLKITIAGGNLSIGMQGQVGGVSGAGQGVIAPAPNLPNLLNSPPGLVYWNGVVIYTPAVPPVIPPVIPISMPEPPLDDTTNDSSTDSDSQDPLEEDKQEDFDEPLSPDELFPVEGMTLEFGGYEVQVFCWEGEIYIIPLDKEGKKRKRMIIHAVTHLIDFSKYRFPKLYDFGIKPYLQK